MFEKRGSKVNRAFALQRHWRLFIRCDLNWNSFGSTFASRRRRLYACFAHGLAGACAAQQAVPETIKFRIVGLRIHPFGENFPNLVLCSLDAFFCQGMISQSLPAKRTLIGDLVFCALDLLQ